MGRYSPVVVFTYNRLHHTQQTLNALIVDCGEPLTIIVSVLCSVSLLFQVMDTFNYWFQSRYESKVTSIATFVAYTVTALYRIILLLLHKNVKWFAFATSVDYICLGATLLYVYKKHNGPTLVFQGQKERACCPEVTITFYQE